jgi:hypothetical protein
MKKILLLFLPLIALSTSSYGQVFQENWDGIGPGIAGWSLYDQDGLTVNTGVSFVNAAWVSTTSEFDNNVAMSTSWYTPAGTSNDWLVSPAITLPAGINTLYWDGRAYDPTYPDSYKVYVSTTGNTVADFSTEELAVAPEATTWTHHTLDLSAYSGQTIHIAFQNFSTDMFLLALDNISVVNNGTCDQPERNMASSSTTTTSLTLNWTAIAGATGYDIAFGAPGFTPSTATYTSATNSYNVTGLAENSRYQYYVRNSCGGMWVGPNSCFTAKNLSYAYGFDTVGGYQQDGWLGSWSLGTTLANAQAGIQYAFSNSSTTVATNRSVFSRPIYLHTGEQATVSFYHKESSATANRSLRLRVIAEATPTVSTVVWTASALQSSTAYTQVTAPVFTAPSNGTYYFEFNDFTPIVTAASAMRLDTVNIATNLGITNFIDNNLSVYPNPASNVITVSNSANAVIKTIEMTDLNGRVVKTLNVNANEGQISVIDLATGVYMMKINTDQGTAVKKIVKE